MKHAKAFVVAVLLVSLLPMQASAPSVGYVWGVNYKGMSAHVKTIDVFLLPGSWKHYCQYSAIIFDFDPEVYIEIGHVKDNNIYPKKQYFYEWKSYSGMERKYFTPGPDSGSYHTYKIFDDAADGIDDKYYFYIGSDLKGSKVIDIPPVRLEPLTETASCSISIDSPHFDHICYYYGPLWPDPWRYWTDHGTMNHCEEYSITEVSDYEYRGSG